MTARMSLTTPPTRPSGPAPSLLAVTAVSPATAATAVTALPRMLVALACAGALVGPLLGASSAWADEDTGEMDARRGRPVTHEDVWSQPNPGVRYLRRTTTRPAVIHAIVVDLHTPGVRVEATRHEDRWSTVSEFAETGPGYAAAINGGFWSSFADPYGLQVGGGEAWPSLEDDGETTLFAIRADGRARITHRTGRTPTNNHYRAAVSGIPTLVRAGSVADSEIDRIGAAYGRHPRTAVGVSRDGYTVFLVVVDGRRNGSRGLNLYELADFMRDIGAHDAMNLDGGGSSAMFLRRAGGIINAPSGGRWEARLGFGSDEVTRGGSDGDRRVYVRGVEREVMNHLGVVAPEPLPITASTASVLDAPVSAPSGTVVLPPRQSQFRFGRLRESLRWAAPLGGALLLVGVWLVRRRRRAASMSPQHVS
ncbi:MAG: phosphodiester glycosidase family protein [Sandaracinaceae bacterium]|nr:phosphodiester glycosidase family protein [Sandaracinaceae bacterium]